MEMTMVLIHLLLNMELHYVSYVDVTVAGVK